MNYTNPNRDPAGYVREFVAALAKVYRDQHPTAAPPGPRRRTRWLNLARRSIPTDPTCHCGLGFGFGPDPAGHPRLTPQQVGKGKKSCPVR